MCHLKIQLAYQLCFSLPPGGAPFPGGVPFPRELPVPPLHMGPGGDSVPLSHPSLQGAPGLPMYGHAPPPGPALSPQMKPGM